MKLFVTERAGAIGRGPPVVLLHGLFGQGRNLGVVARGLAAGHRVLSLDLRNHGRSPHAAGMTYSGMAADVLDTLRDAGALPAAVVGHSMGGKVAMRLALDTPEAVACLVVADIAPRPNPPHFGPIADAMTGLDLSGGRAKADAALAAAAPTTDAPLRAFLLGNATIGPGGGWRIGLAEIRAALPDIEGWPPTGGKSFAGPTLVLTGALSAYVRADDRALFLALFPRARFVAVPNAGHWLHADNPDAVTRALADFLQEESALTADDADGRR